MSDEPIVVVVDDDLEMRESLVWLLESAGLKVHSYAGPAELLEKHDPERPGCLVVDLRLPGMSGLELQRRFSAKGSRHPFIVISAHGDISSAVQSLRQGAVDFLEKPFQGKQLVSLVRSALVRDAVARERAENRRRVQARMDSLTPREKEVMELVVQGMATKQIARKLKIRDKTVEVHRSHVTKKMDVQSVAQLVRIVTEMELDGPNNTVAP